MVRGSDFELVVSPLPNAAPLSVRGGVPLSPARSAQRTAHRHQLLSELRVSAQHGCGEGQVGHQHNNGRRRVQQVDGTDSVREGEGVRSDGGPRPARHQRALEGKAVRDDSFKVKPRKVSAVGRS